MQHYPSLFLRHSLASPLNHSHFLPYHCYHKSSGNAFSLVLVHSICFFSFQAPDTLKREGERCNNQRILYGTEEQPMNFFFLGKVQDIHYINFDSPTEFKRLTRSRLASSWRPGSENVRCCFFPPWMTAHRSRRRFAHSFLGNFGFKAVLDDPNESHWKSMKVNLPFLLPTPTARLIAVCPSLLVAVKSAPCSCMNKNKHRNHFWIFFKYLAIFTFKQFRTTTSLKTIT